MRLSGGSRVSSFECGDIVHFKARGLTIFTHNVIKNAASYFWTGECEE
jgi:hypothetical protein